VGGSYTSWSGRELLDTDFEILAGSHENLSFVSGGVTRIQCQPVACQSSGSPPCWLGWGGGLILGGLEAIPTSNVVGGSPG